MTDAINEKTRTGLNMYLEGIIEDVDRSIPDIGSVNFIREVIEYQLKEVKSYLDSSGRRENLRKEDLKKLASRYNLTKLRYQKEVERQRVSK